MGNALLPSLSSTIRKIASASLRGHYIGKRFVVATTHLSSTTKRGVSSGMHNILRSTVNGFGDHQRRIHVLGLGSIGVFAAHALAEAPSRANITLLLHRQSLLDQYIQNGNRVSLQTNDGEVIHHSDYDFEIRNHDAWYTFMASQARGSESFHLANASATNEIIENLIVSVKAPQTVAALTLLRQRLNQNSNILFLQNGSGMMDAVDKELFPDPNYRPNYIVGVISHGVNTNRPFHITHTGPSATSLGLVPRQPVQNSGSDLESVQEPYLINVLCAIPRFNAKSYSFIDVFQLQLEKLAVNAFTNPITALNDSNNSILKSMSSTRQQLMAEISAIVQGLPELRNTPGVKARFSPERLDETVMAIVEKNAKSTPSMVWDLRANKTTEVRFINGYWSKRGREVGVDTPINDDLVEKVEALTLEKQKRNQKH